MKSFDIRPKKKIVKPKIKLGPPSPFEVPRRRAWPVILILSVSVIIIAAGFLVFLVLPEAKIEILARTEPVTRDFEIRIDKNQQEPNASELAAPAKILEKEVTGTKTFPATGTRNIGRKASGFVTLYNFSKTTLILKAQTTVLEAGSRQYAFTQDVGSIRPTAFIGLEDQEIDESSLIPPVPVAALGPGTEYNLPKGTRLEIKNEVFGYQPQALYAVVSDSISGGTDEIIKVITEQDLLNAGPALAQELLANARSELTAQNPGLRIADNAVSYEVLEQKTSFAAGKEVPEFEAAMKLKFEAIAYDEKQILEIIIERIKRLLPQNKILQEDKDARLTTQLLTASFEAGGGILGSHYEGRLFYAINEQDLLTKLKGKSIEEIREILLSRPEIEEVTINFYPFWVKKAPKFGNKVHINVRID